MLIASLALLLVAIALGAIGQVLLKSGLRQLGEHPAPLLVLRSIVTNRRIFSGFACYGFSSLLYIVALSRLDLSYAYLFMDERDISGNAIPAFDGHYEFHSEIVEVTYRYDF